MTDKNALVASLQPLISRLRTDTCWIVKPGSTPARIDSPLTDARMLRHVDGGPRVGAVPIKAGESTTRVGVLDLDSHKGEVSWGDMQALALQVMDKAAGDAGLRLVPFRSSGGNGMHLYALWGAPQDAYSVRVSLRALLRACGFQDGTGGVSEGQIEVFPKQNTIPISGFGNMFVLPLAGKSCPLDPLDLDDMPLEAMVGVDWPMSDPVPVVERPAPVVRDAAIPASEELKVLASALDAIPNAGLQELNYDAWFSVLCGIHAGSRGSDEGLQLAHTFSARSSKYDPGLIDNIKWPSIKLAHDGEHGGITAGTVYRYAREHGWVEPVEDQFSVIVPASSPRGEPVPKELPVFLRDKYGKIEPILDNLMLALERADVCGVDIRYDSFRDQVTLSDHHAGATAQWRPLRDTDYTYIRRHLENNGFKPLSMEMMRYGLAGVAHANSFDSAIQWVESLKWDGAPRVDRFLRDYFGTDDTPYTRAVSRYLWTALAGRASVPGVQADMVPILISKQGTQKSSMIAAMAPIPDTFAEIDLHDKEADQARKMRGVLVGELAELKGLNSKDEQSIRAFITRRKEEWTPKYQEHKVSYLRRSVLIGTENRKEVLADRTGNRRWLPTLIRQARIDLIERDRDQLWAEGKFLFDMFGVEFEEAEKLAEDVHPEFMIRDPWDEVFEQWLETSDELSGETPASRKFLLLQDVARECFNLDIRNMDRKHERRIGDVLRAKNYDRKVVWYEGKTVKAWCLTLPLP